MHFDDKVNPQGVAYPVAVEIEERILGILMLFPDQYAKCDAITKDDFVTDFSAKIFSEISALYSENITDLTSLNEVFTPEEMSRIFEMRYRRSELTSNGVGALNEQIAALKKEKAKVLVKSNSISSDDDLMDVISRARKDKGIN